MNLPNPYPEHRGSRHPHRRRLPKHARHLVSTLMGRPVHRASVLQTQVKQLDSAVNLREHPDRVHPDTDRVAKGVRVALGPETRSLLRQLRQSRDLRVQQQLVREIIHQVQRRIFAAAKRIRAIEKTREQAGKAARTVRKRAGQLWLWAAARPRWAREAAARRNIRVVGGRKPMAPTRARKIPPAVRKPAAAARTDRAPANPASRSARGRAARTTPE